MVVEALQGGAWREVIRDDSFSVPSSDADLMVRACCPCVWVCGCVLPVLYVVCLCVAVGGLAWSGLVWLGLAWSGLVWSGLVWPGLVYGPGGAARAA
jgi:hypothetical protein